jgi:hypothetical protein
VKIQIDLYTIFALAAIEAIKQFPNINVSVDGTKYNTI